MPGTNQPQHGIQGLSAKLQEFTRRLTSLEAWQRTMSIPASPWVTPTLINSWAAFTPVGYLKDPLGFVHMKGILISGASGTVAFVLPVGFRPGQSLQMPGGTGSTSVVATVAIATSGTVTLVGTPSVGIGPDGITFLAEN